MRKLYPIVEGREDVATAFQVLELFVDHGIHLLDPRRWLAIELPVDLMQQPAWPRLEDILRDNAGGLAVVARMIGMMADSNPPAEMSRRLRQLSGQARAVSESVLGRHVGLLTRRSETLAPAERDLLSAALVAALAHAADGPER